MPTLPNIVLCVVDQMRAVSVGCYGDPVAHTPNIDRLAQGGALVKTAISPNPVCAPARSCLLSGQYSRTAIGTVYNCGEPVADRLGFPAPTLAEILKRRGYRTALFGKWHVCAQPRILGFESALYGSVEHRNVGETFYRDNRDGFVVDGYAADFRQAAVGGFLSSAHERPFFLYYSIEAPHMPLADIPEPYRSMYDPATISLRPNVFVNGVAAHDPVWFKVYLWDSMYYQDHEPGTETLPDVFDIRALTALYYGSCAWADAQVGFLLDCMQSNGLLENTIVVFTSDHGDNLGSHHLFNKDCLMEESIRVPLAVRGPSVKPGRLVDGGVYSLIDVAPTLLALAGIDPQPGMHGKPIPVGSEPDDAARVGFIETDGGEIGVRTATHMLGMPYDLSANRLIDGVRHFYNIGTDPYELTNLAAANSESDVHVDLEVRLRAWDCETPWSAPAYPPPAPLILE